MGVGSVAFYLALENSLCSTMIDNALKEGTAPVPPDHPIAVR
jgi:hypothetical protein